MAGFAPEVLAKLASIGLYAPLGIGGEKFFVSGFNGSDTLNDGKSFLSPFQTIEHALEQCEDERGDYIFCWEVYQQDTFPIEVEVNGVHIIGIANPAGQWPLMVPTGNTAIFSFPVGLGENVEIAGFSLGAGADHACIEFQGNNGMSHIHHCSFGHDWAVAGQDGIHYLNGGVTVGVVVEDCWFYGNTRGAGKLTRCGIICENGWVAHGTFRNNFFFKLPGHDLHGTGYVGGAILGQWFDQCAIIHNIITVGDGDTKSGNGIYLEAGCKCCLVAENEANEGMVADAKNPFVDVCDANDNAWICNQRDCTLTDPATSIA